MQRVYGEFIINGTTADENVVPAIKEFEKTNIGINPVPEKFVIRKLGVKADAACVVYVNGRPFKLGAGEPLEFGYDSIKVDSLKFNVTGINVVIRYMYFREDQVYQ